jgi:hypothetical protein
MGFALRRVLLSATFWNVLLGLFLFFYAAPLRIWLTALKFSPWWKKYGATGTHTITHQNTEETTKISDPLWPDYCRKGNHQK